MLKKWFKLILCCACLWVFIYVVTPFMVSHSPTHQKIGEMADLYDIPVGAMYYSDLKHIAVDAFFTTFDTWRFTPTGPHHKKDK